MLTNLRCRILGKFRSQANFAEIANIDEAKLSRVINERKKLPEAEQERWAKILGIDRERLFKS